MRQIREFRSNFESISHDCRAIVARLSHDSRATFVRVSHDFPANVSNFHFNSYESRSFIFSPDSREFFACCLKTVARPTFVRVSQTFRIVNSPKFRGDRFATFARTSRDRRATVARQSWEIFWEKNSHPIFKPVRDT